MARVVSEIVDVYVFRKRIVEVEYLLLHRAPEEVLAGTWQAVHGRIEAGERAYETALRELREETRLTPRSFFQIDVVNTFYLVKDDTVHHCPCFAVEVDEDAEPVLNGEHDAYRWVSLEAAIAQFPWPGQRRAIREIDREIVQGGPALEFLRISLA